MIVLSPKLLESSVRYGNNIAIWANKVETRYKEFFNLMSKIQQAHGLQPTINNFTSSTTSLASTSSLSPSIQSTNSTVLASNSSLINTSYDNSSITSIVEPSVSFNKFFFFRVLKMFSLFKFFFSKETNQWKQEKARDLETKWTKTKAN